MFQKGFSKRENRWRTNLEWHPSICYATCPNLHYLNVIHTETYITYIQIPCDNSFSVVVRNDLIPSVTCWPKERACENERQWGRGWKECWDRKIDAVRWWMCLCDHYHVCPVSSFFQGQELKSSTVYVKECACFMAITIPFYLQYQSHSPHTLNIWACICSSAHVQFYFDC